MILVWFQGRLLIDQGLWRSWSETRVHDHTKQRNYQSNASHWVITYPSFVIRANANFCKTLPLAFGSIMLNRHIDT